MYKNILVCVTGTDGDGAVFETARLAGVAFAAHLEFLHVRVDTADVMMNMAAGGVGGGDAVQAVVDRMDAAAAQQEALARRAVGSFCDEHAIVMREVPTALPQVEALSGEFNLQIGNRAGWVAQLGRFADLVVVGRGAPDSDDGEVLEAALMDTGKPLLIAPLDSPPTMGRTVAIAWKDTPEAAQAVSFALPLIARADRVVVLSVLDDDQEDDRSVARLLRALRWHNPRLEQRIVARSGRPAVEMLHSEAAALGADLLVMGGYSHSRLREVVFGGFTRQTLQSASIPVLMAH